MDEKSTKIESQEYLGRSIYWHWPLSKGTISLRQTYRQFIRFTSILLFSLIILGIICLVWWFYKNHDLWTENPWKLIYFWQNQDWRILFFEISALFILFLSYRQSEKVADQKKIVRLKPLSGKLVRYNIASAFNDETLEIIEDAFVIASKLRQKEVTTRHLAWAIFNNNEIRTLFVRLNLDGAKFLEKLKKYLLDPDQRASLLDRTTISLSLQKVFLQAYVEAYERKQSSVAPLNLVLFLIESDLVVKEIFYDLEITQDKIQNGVAWFRINDQLRQNYSTYKKKARFKPSSSMNRSYTAIATPTLNHFSHDLTLAAKFGYLEMCVARNKEVNAVFEAIEGGHGGVLLVGPNGVGKRGIVNGIAQLMVKEEVPKFLQDKRLVEVDISRLVAGADAAEAQKRLLYCINEASLAGNIILFIEDLENIAGISTGGEQSLELADVLADSLSRNQIVCLATASLTNYSKYIEGQPLGEAMTTVPVNEPELNQAIQILESKVGFLEGKYNVYFAYNALEQAVKLSDRYIKDKFLPEKAINVLQTTAVRLHKNSSTDKEIHPCTRDDIAQTINELTKIPVAKLTENESYKLLNLETEIHKRMIDQEEAVRAVCSSLRRARAEIREGKRPIANFLFLGPTGVGKTELAKSVADVYFGDEKYMIRLDMSEYQHPDSIIKMIGDHDNLGYLTEAVRKQPFALVLFDEIEKAHPQILNLFLQMMDDGRLTDGLGRTIDFTNSIIIATSNAGAVFIQDELKAGRKIEAIKEGLIEDHLNQVMRPELINRFDGIIVFKTLSQQDVLAIAKLMLKKIGTMLEKKGIGLAVTEEGAMQLAHDGYDPKFGARPLRRLLQDTIENEIANKILASELNRRDTVVINVEGKVEVRKAALI